MPTDIKKVPIPSDSLELIDLGVKIYARHCIMGEESPLLALQVNTWEENGHKVNSALRFYELIDEGFNPSQAYIRIHDEQVIKLRATIQASHDLLLDIFHDNPTNLGYWGFHVEE
jgi:hypothetical protein